MAYELGIDVGTTYTAAALAHDGRTEIFSLGDRAAAIPSVVFLGEEGNVLIGEGATRRSVREPGRVARAFKRRLGDQTPILLGGVPVSAESLTAKLLRWTVDRVSEQEGTKPESIGISHPANWGPYKIDLLKQAIEMAGLDVPVTTLSEPEAAAIHYSSTERVDVGDLLAVYDLGGGTFDACVLRKTESGFEVLGRPEGIERLGGIDFDEAIFDHVLRSVDGGVQIPDPAPPAVITAAAQLRRECVEAKEALSADTEVTVPVLFPDTQGEVTVTRAEFERMIREPLAETAKALRRALQSAGVQPSEVKRVLLVGGSSRIPLVASMVSAELDRPVGIDLNPKHSVALGAGIAAGAALKAASLVEEAPEAPPTVAAGAAAGERTVASGPADTQPAAAAAPPPPPATDAGAEEASGRDSRRRALLIGGPIAAVIAVVLAIVLLTGGDGDGAEETAGAPAGAPETPAATREGGLVAGDWRAVREAPTARQQVAATAVKGQVYVLGGLIGQRGLDDVEIYDPFISSWRSGPSLPEPLHHAAAVKYRGAPVVIGGWEPVGRDLTAEVSDSVYILDGDSWEELPSLPEPRVAGAAAVVNGEIVFAGGQNADGELAEETYVFDGEGWREGAPIPTPREHVGAASDDRFMYVVGGRELSPDANSDALERYDPATDTWTTLPSLLTPRGSIGGAAIVRDQLVAVGGETGDGVLGSAEVFDIPSGTWAELPDLPTAVHGPGIAQIRRSVLVIGGATQTGHAASTAAAYTLDFAGDS